MWFCICPPLCVTELRRWPLARSLSLNLFVLMAVAEKLQRLQLQYLLEISEKEEIHSVTNPTGDSLVH